MARIMTQKDIKEIASNLLFFLNSASLDSYEKIERQIGPHHFPIDGETLEILFRPSNQTTQALTLSYIKEGYGVPLEVRMNKSLGYSLVVVKLNEYLTGYKPMAIDCFGNVVQTKRLETLFVPVKEELISLSEL